MELINRSEEGENTQKGKKMKEREREKIANERVKDSRVIQPWPTLVKRGK